MLLYYKFTTHCRKVPLVKSSVMKFTLRCSLSSHESMNVIIF